MEIKEVRVQILVASTSSSSRVVVPCVVEIYNNQDEQQINDTNVNNGPVIEQPQEVVFRRSHRDRKIVISNDYMVYLQN